MPAPPVIVEGLHGGPEVALRRPQGLVAQMQRRSPGAVVQRQAGRPSGHGGDRLVGAVGGCEEPRPYLFEKDGHPSRFVRLAMETESNNVVEKLAGAVPYPVA